MILVGKNMRPEVSALDGFHLNGRIARLSAHSIGAHIKQPLNAPPAGGMSALPRLMAAVDEIRQPFGARSPLLPMHAEIRARMAHIASSADSPFVLGGFG